MEKPRRTRHFRWRDFKKPWPEASTLQDVLTDTLAQLGMDEDKVRLTHLWECWPYVMGPELSTIASPLGSHNGTLLVGCEDNMLMQEVTLCQYDILERANAFMEKPYFHNVKVSLFMGKRNLAQPRQAPRPEPPKAPRIAACKVHGTYLDRISLDTPWGRCYAAYAGRDTQT